MSVYKLHSASFICMWKTVGLIAIQANVNAAIYLVFGSQLNIRETALMTQYIKFTVHT